MASATNKILACLLVAMVGAYAVAFLWFSPLLLVDYPNHLARAIVMSDLMFHGGEQFGTVFSYRFLVAPYLLADLLLAAMVNVLGVTTAAAIWIVLVFLSLPFALIAYLRATQTPLNASLLMLLISLYLSTDTFFVFGFLSFRLGIALVILAVAMAEFLRRDWSTARFMVFVGIVAAAYFTHFAAVVFIATALGTSAAVRLSLHTSRLRHELLLFAPIAAVLAWHFLVEGGYRQPHDAVAEVFFWGTPGSKLSHLLWNFQRYKKHWDELLMAALVVSLLCFVGTGGALRSGTVVRGKVLEPWSVAAAFLGVYLVLPSTYSEASFVDVRALPLATLFGSLGLLNLPLRTRVRDSARQALGAGVATVLAVLNLAYLSGHFRAGARWLADYRAVVARIPEHARVLPVYIGIKEGVLRPSLHAASFVVTDRAGMIPYLFTGDAGAPMKYFRYRDRPYAPDERWYDTQGGTGVDWREVAAQYRFLLVMKPFDRRRIPLSGTTIAENQAAALLAIHR